MLNMSLVIHTVKISDRMSRIFDNVIHEQQLPKSKHVAGDCCICVVKIITTHSSPGVVVVDFKTSGIRRPVVTSKSNRHYTRTMSPAVKSRTYTCVVNANVYTYVPYVRQHTKVV